MAYSRTFTATDAEGGFHNIDPSGKQSVAELMAELLPPDKQPGAALLTPNGSLFTGEDSVESLLEDVPRGEVARITRSLPAG